MEYRLPTSVQRVTVLEPNSNGRVTSIYQKKRKKKRKGTMGVREAEVLIRRLAQAQQTFINSYLGRHKNSQRKKRDGWLIDSPKNVFRATEKSFRKLI